MSIRDVEDSNARWDRFACILYFKREVLGSQASGLVTTIQMPQRKTGR